MTVAPRDTSSWRKPSAWPLRLLGYQTITVIMVALATACVLAVVTVPLLPLLVLLFAAIERRRGVLLGYPAIPLPPRGQGGDTVGARLHRGLAYSVSWRPVASFLATVVIGGVQCVLGYYCSMVASSAAMLPAQVAAYRNGTSGWTPAEPILLPSSVNFRITDAPQTVFWIAATILLLAVAWYAGSVLARVQAQVVGLLLSPREAELEGAVAELEGSRSTLIDSFENDRVRIERDLHDGAQQHLVLTALLVGTAARQVRALEAGSGNGPVLATLEKAQASAELALSTLRRTVLGFYTDVLTDHGITAAVEELAQRSVVPLAVHSSLHDRYAPALERCAYFAVSEAVTNALKHSAASLIEVHLSDVEGRLMVRVADDGHGGADHAAGTGIRGLRERARSLGGTLAMSSPSGGPTVLALEIPLGERGDARRRMSG
ncbi:MULTISPECIES: sensor histidine kinase [unclassified Rathayibacter]|uniref:sensor histidine kinase n=1 Tax=unclassified Rathayibacter TaxID=2609250 RepID=UPI00188C0100|nr:MULTISPECIES: histidine kinase [unclassified Rathayibacter]MBF4463287.1 sensor domain-containing protein [Rathayibacter sp. VKM Ac-2879]MBF4504476.1 sensor domain-containing protein [Rathayibacter sp. VKM Ac-2878]